MNYRNIQSFAENVARQQFYQNSYINDANDKILLLNYDFAMDCAKTSNKFLLEEHLNQFLVLLSAFSDINARLRKDCTDSIRSPNIQKNNQFILSFLKS